MVDTIDVVMYTKTVILAFTISKNIIRKTLNNIFQMSGIDLYVDVTNMIITFECRLRND